MGKDASGAGKGGIFLPYRKVLRISHMTKTVIAFIFYRIGFGCQKR